MTPFAHLSSIEKTAFRARAFSHGVVDGIEGLRDILMRKSRVGVNAVNKMRGLADKVPGKAVPSIFDQNAVAADRWRSAGAGTVAGGVGSAAGVGLSQILRQLGVYDKLGIENKQPTSTLHP
jgi:hypothetical protein